MNTAPLRQGAALIFAINESAARVGAELIQLIDQACNCSDCLRITGTGDALRLIYRHEPPLVFVCLGIEKLDQVSGLIEALRSRRPRLPQLAVTGEHDQQIERLVRSAGASHYFALDCPADAELLQQTLETLSSGSIDSPGHSGRPPPRCRGVPPNQVLKQ